MKKSKPLTQPQREALEWLVQGKSLRGLTHGITIDHLHRKRLIKDADTITEAGRKAISATTDK